MMATPAHTGATPPGASSVFPPFDATTFPSQLLWFTLTISQ